MALFETDDATLHFEVHGTGPVLVLTHGASWDLRQWTPQIEAFEDDHTVVVWDVRGHGRSSLPPGPVDAESFTSDLIALLDHLSVDRAVLGGLSLGGHISLRTAARHPDRVRGLVLIGTPFTNAFNRFERLAMPLNRWSTRVLPMSWQAGLQARVLSDVAATRAYAADATGSIPHDHWVRLWDAISRMESRPDLERIACPTLVISGGQDRLAGRQQKALVAGVAGAEHVVIPGAGHGTNLDAPEAVNAAIRQFLAALDEG